MSQEELQSTVREKPRVAILGGGITGLSAAWHLRESCREVIIFDPAEGLGGAVQTHKDEGFLWENGPNSLLLRRMETYELIEQLGLAEHLVTPERSARKRFIAWDGRLHALAGPLSLLTTRLLSWRGKFGLLLEAFRPKASFEPSESLGSYIRRRFGPQWADRIFNAFIHGTYAGDVDRLLVDWTYPSLVEAEQSNGSLLRHLFKRSRGEKKAKPPVRGILSFSGGLNELTDRLFADSGATWVKASPSNICREQSGWELSWIDATGVARVDVFEAVICCVPLTAIPQLPLRVDRKDTLSTFPTLPRGPVVVQTLAFRREDCPHPLDGFGFLIPEGEGVKVLGVLFSSSLFPGRAPEGKILLTVFLGGIRHPELINGTEAERDELTAAVLKQYLGISNNFLWRREKIWVDGIPQRMEPLPTILDTLRAFEKNYPGWCFLGNYRETPGLPECLQQGAEVPLRLEAELTRVSEEADWLVPADLAPASLRRHEFFMRQALEEAALAKGSTHPNPMVGAVLVRHGRILARAHHQKAGEPHAERLLLRQWQGKVPHDSVLYVTLEPCCTHGRTPPCTDILLDKGVHHVVVGAVDNNPRHQGEGLRLLRRAGLTVIAGVLAEECRTLNKAFHDRMEAEGE
jgi:oxygen-dependent protoporphyrinogen oxidase